MRSRQLRLEPRKTPDHGCGPRAECNRAVNANAPKVPWYARQNSSRPPLDRAYPAATISSSAPATSDHPGTALFRSMLTSAGSHLGKNNPESKAGVCDYSPAAAQEPHILRERKRRWAAATGPFPPGTLRKLQKNRPLPMAQEILSCHSMQLEADLQPAFTDRRSLNSLRY